MPAFFPNVVRKDSIKGLVTDTDCIGVFKAFIRC
jgi:hypothetical protein